MMHRMRLPALAQRWHQRLAEPLQAWRGRAQAGWQRRTPREQILLRTAGLLLVVVVPWITVIQPTWHHVQDTRQRLMTLSLDAAELQALILETQSLQQHTPGRMSIQERAQALDDSLVRSGLSTQVRHAAPAPTDDTPAAWSLTFDQAPASSLLAWLTQTPGLLGLRAESLTLTRSRAQGREIPDRLDGTVRLVTTDEAPS